MKKWWSQFIDRVWFIAACVAYYLGDTNLALAYAMAAVYFKLGDVADALNRPYELIEQMQSEEQTQGEGK